MIGPSSAAISLVMILASESPDGAMAATRSGLLIQERKKCRKSEHAAFAVMIIPPV
jgi:hypothetical protein